MLKPLNNNVVLEIVEVEKTTASGIILSGEASKPKLLDNGKRHPITVEVGQRVIYNGFGGTKVSHQGKELVILSQDDILAIVE